MVQRLDSEHWSVFQVLGGIVNSSVGFAKIIPKNDRIFDTLASALGNVQQQVEKNTPFKRPKTGSTPVRRINTVAFFWQPPVSRTPKPVQRKHTPRGFDGFPLTIE